MYYVGTSGFAFKEWKGPFYPPTLSDKEMLGYYAGHFPAVEINNTFYRMPREANLVEWASQVPGGFRFAIKASQRITHHSQLKDVKELVDYLATTCSALGDKLGPVLFQLPPHLKKDLPRLTDFLATLPRRWKAAIEFRHRSWFDEEVFDALRSRDVSLCVTDQDDLETPRIATAPWGYLRLHRVTYEDQALSEWADRIRALRWSESYVFFKHDHGPASGPPVAETLLTKLSA